MSFLPPVSDYKDIESKLCHFECSEKSFRDSTTLRYFAFCHTQNDKIPIIYNLPSTAAFCILCAYLRHKYSIQWNLGYKIIAKSNKSRYATKFIYKL